MKRSRVSGLSTCVIQVIIYLPEFFSELNSVLNWRHFLLLDSWIDGMACPHGITVSKTLSFRHFNSFVSHFSPTNKT